MTKHRLPIALALTWLVVCLAGAPAWAVDAGEAKIVKTAPPAEVAEPIRAVLAPSATRVSEKGKPVLDLWLRKEAPLKAKPA